MVAGYHEPGIKYGYLWMDVAANSYKIASPGAT